MRTDLQQAIIQTLAYFDGCNYAPTLIELQRYLWRHEAVEVSDILTEVVSNPKLHYENGLICFVDRTQLIHERNIRYKQSTRKLRKRMPYIKALTYLPHVRAIFLVNSVAWLNAHEQSDVDILIVTTPGKIWSARFFTTLFAKVLGIRPQPNHTKDTLCLSFYLNANSTNTQKLMSETDDIYEVYWHEQILPLYDPANIRSELEDTNTWLHAYVPNGYIKMLHPELTIRSSWLQRASQWLLEWLCIEPLWRWVELSILPKQLRDLAGPVESAVVVLSDTVLKFHTQDPRPAIKERWLETIRKYS